MEDDERKKPDTEVPSNLTAKRQADELAATLKAQRPVFITHYMHYYSPPRLDEALFGFKLF